MCMGLKSFWIQILMCSDPRIRIQNQLQQKIKIDILWANSLSGSIWGRIEIESYCRFKSTSYILNRFWAVHPSIYSNKAHHLPWIQLWNWISNFSWFKIWIQHIGCMLDPVQRQIHPVEYRSGSRTEYIMVLPWIQPIYTTYYLWNLESFAAKVV